MISISLWTACSLLCDLLLQNADDDVHIIPLLLDCVLELVNICSNVFNFVGIVLHSLRARLLWSESHQKKTAGDLPSSHSIQSRCLLQRVLDPRVFQEHTEN